MVSQADEYLASHFNDDLEESWQRIIQERTRIDAFVVKYNKSCLAKDTKTNALLGSVDDLLSISAAMLEAAKI